MPSLLEKQIGLFLKIEGFLAVGMAITHFK